MERPKERRLKKSHKGHGSFHHSNFLSHPGGFFCPSGRDLRPPPSPRGGFLFLIDHKPLSTKRLWLV